MKEIYIFAWLCIITSFSSSVFAADEFIEATTFRCEGIFNSFGEFEFELPLEIQLYKDPSVDLYQTISISGFTGKLQASNISYSFDFPTQGGMGDSISGSIDRHTLKLSFIQPTKGIGIMSYKGACKVLKAPQI